jgi:dimethylglycine dehydrogenase
MGLIDPALAKPGTNVLVHVVGAERKAKIIAASPYDPEGRAMRG